MKHEFNPLDDCRLNDIEPWAAEIGKPDITELMMRIPLNPETCDIIKYHKLIQTTDT